MKDDIALRMAVLKYVADRIKPVQEDLRAQARELWKKKERIPVEVGGETVATVGKTSPKRTARVDDEPKLLAWMQEHYPECIDAIPYVEDMPRVIAALELHAPHLVHYREAVDPTMVPKLLAAAEEVGAPVGPGGEADVPGITVDTPEGTVAVYLDKANAPLIEHLIKSGRISLDGTVRGEIEP